MNFSMSKPVILAFALALAPVSAFAQLSPELQAKVDTYKTKLVEWAANPVLVNAVKDANTKGGMYAGMTNAKWDELADGDPMIAALQSSEAGKLVTTWEGDTNISKLYVRDEKGNIVASSNRPLLYNNATKPPFANAIKGTPWNANEVKPDPASQVKGVHVSVPVMDGGKPIGVLQSNVVAQ